MMKERTKALRRMARANVQFQRARLAYIAAANERQAAYAQVCATEPDSADRKALYGVALRDAGERL
jgi:hypothetical protein